MPSLKNLARKGLDENAFKSMSILQVVENYV